MVDKNSSKSAAAPWRRSSDPRRKQDPERTRRSILTAAADEFSKHGYQGARVTRIAEAAGVGHQLIAYHFGGKKGLYDALTERWLDHNMELISSPDPFVEVVRQYVHWAHEDEGWARTVTREALEGGFPISDERFARLVEIVEKTRMRQKRGEFSEDFEVGALSLAFFAACIAPAILPAVARAFVGLAPESTEFRDLYAEQLARIVAALRAADPGSGPASP